MKDFWRREGDGESECGELMEAPDDLEVMADGFSEADARSTRGGEGDPIVVSEADLPARTRGYRR